VKVGVNVDVGVSVVVGVIVDDGSGVKVLNGCDVGVRVRVGVGVFVRVGLGAGGAKPTSFKIIGRYMTESALLFSRGKLLYRSEKLRNKRRHENDMKNRKWDILV